MKSTNKPFIENLNALRTFALFKRTSTDFYCRI